MRRGSGGREGGIEFLLGREVNEHAIVALPASMRVEEVHHRRSVVWREAVTVPREVHAEAMLCAEQRMGRAGAGDRLQRP